MMAAATLGIASLDAALWYLVRSSGWVALVLGVLALFLGFIFSARDTIGAKPAWWLDLHNYLGGIALVFTGVHMVAVIGESTNGLGVVETLVPFTSGISTTGMTLGIISFWLFAAAVFTSWPKKLLSRKIWRWVHLGSVGGVALAGIHTWMVGTDAASPVGKAVLLACTALFSYPFAVRLLGRSKRRPARRTPSAPVGGSPRKEAYATR